MVFESIECKHIVVVHLDGSDTLIRCSTVLATHLAGIPPLSGMTQGTLRGTGNMAAVGTYLEFTPTPRCR